MSDLQWATVDRDMVQATGPDTITFLQGQLSQDIAGLAVGDSAFSLLLQPEGKVEVFLRVTRTGDEEVVLDTDAGWGDAMVDRLERFKLRTRCDLKVLPWRCMAVRGADAGSLTIDEGSGSWAVQAETPGVPGVDVLGPDPQPAEGAVPMSAETYEALRISTGVPRMGRELDASTIPAAAGIVDRSVSFTKGCFTGQELVARIDSRGGNVPRRLRGIVSDSPVVPAGAPVLVGDREVGTITSAVAEPSGRGMVGLAYVHRSVDAPCDAVLRSASGEVRALIQPLPLPAS